jgi:hypothetical protein
MAIVSLCACGRGALLWTDGGAAQSAADGRVPHPHPVIRAHQVQADYRGVVSLPVLLCLYLSDLPLFCLSVLLSLWLSVCLYILYV